MSAFPIHAALERDFLVQLIVVDLNDSMDQVAEKVAYHCVGRRVAPREGVMRAWPQPLPAGSTGSWRARYSTSHRRVLPNRTAASSSRLWPVTSTV